MHYGVVDVLGTCCIYLRATHRPWMHWLWSHRGAHDDVQMHYEVVDVMVTCWSYLRATHRPWMHWLWSHVVLWISDESRVKFVYFRDKLWHDEECLPHWEEVLMFEQHREDILPYIYIYGMIFIMKSINIYNKYVVIYYPRDASFHGWSPYVLYIWKNHHCNNIFTYNIISYRKFNKQQIISWL